MSKTTPPHLNRGLQLRMLGCVGLFAIALFALNWFQGNQAKSGRTNNPGRQSASLGRPEDRDRQDGTALKDEEFLSPPDFKQHNQPPIDRPEDWAEPPPLEPMAGDDGIEREIARRETKFDKRYLEKVKDNTIGIRREETDAYYRLLDHARRVPPAELDEAGLTDVQYINLMDQPDHYRGEPIKIHGDLFRLRKFTASHNPQGIRTIYEAWIFTADSSNHPYRVLCTSVPSDFKMADDLRKPVEVTGYFFKREGYASTGGMHVAPTLLANRIELYSAPGAPPPTDAIVPYMIGFISAVTLAFLVTLISFSISDRRAARSIQLRKMNAPTPSFAGIDGGSTNTVAESLRMLEEQEWVDVSHDQAQKDPAVALHARDHVPVHPTSQTSTGPTEEELAERRRIEGQAVQNWTAQHHKTDQHHTASQQLGEQERERRDADRVLDTLQSASLQTSVDEASAEPIDLTADQQVNGIVVPHVAPVQDRNSEPAAVTGIPGNGASKLAAWEQEIQQIVSSRTDINPPGMIADELAAQSEIHRDQQARDRDLRDRLRHERAELAHDQRVPIDQHPEEEHKGTQHPEHAESDHGAVDENHAAGDANVNGTSAHDHLQIDRADRIDHHGLVTRPDASDDDIADEDTEAPGNETEDESDSANSAYDRINNLNRRRRRRGGR